MTDDRWELLERVFNAPGKRGRKHADDLRTVVDATLSIARTGCRWRYLREPFGPWTRVWSQLRSLVAQRHLTRQGDTHRLELVLEGPREVACIATTLHHLSRERARRLPDEVVPVRPSGLEVEPSGTRRRRPR